MAAATAATPAPTGARYINAIVGSKTLVIGCGDGSSSIGWLATTAVARWEAETSSKEHADDFLLARGWRELGTPIRIVRVIKSETGGPTREVLLNPVTKVADVLNHGDTVRVDTTFAEPPADGSVAPEPKFFDARLDQHLTKA